ncbi:MAG TPA: TraB/GumN family protein, partial [Phenylobacterium sp.]|uniref:TraB/GumN family protein n=1 Tax=Phenylobacterium sp. TaxID=1871053 RepID=UPI002B4A8391
MVTGVRKGLGFLAMVLALGAAPAAGVAQGAPPAQQQQAASAANPAPPADPDDVLLQELVVVGRDRGPAWWSVTNGTSTVYVLGAPSLAPKRTAWDTATLDRRLKGASQVILPFQDVKVHFAGSIGAAWNLMRLRSVRPFEDSLDEAARARFVAAREKIGQPASRYKTNNALAAGLLLAGDYRDHAGLTNADTAKVVKVYAKQANVPVVQRTYDVGSLMGAVIRTPKPAARACLDAVLDQVLAGPGVTLAAAKAW